MQKDTFVIFSAHYFPHLGGVERYTFNMADNLIKRGYKVVIVSSKIGNLSDSEMLDGIEVHRLPCVELLDGRYPVLKFWDKKYHQIMSEIKNENRIKLVVINTRFYLHSLFAARFASKNSIPSIIIDHGTSHLTVHNKFWDMVGSWWEHIITALDKLYCKDFYGVSLASCEWLRHFNIEPKGVLYNALDIDKIKLLISSRDTAFRQSYNIPENAKVVAYTGRLLEEKGIKQLISAIENICRLRDDVYLLLAGDGNLEDYVARHKTEHIIPLGRLDYQGVVSLLCESDIFCMPSFSEGFSTSVLEAAACMCYVITTERGGSKELIISKEFGTIIPSNEVNMICWALAEVLDDDERRHNACAKTYEKLEREFVWDVTIKKVLDLTS